MSGLSVALLSSVRSISSNRTNDSWTARRTVEHNERNKGLGRVRMNHGHEEWLNPIEWIVSVGRRAFDQGEAVPREPCLEGVKLQERASIDMAKITSARTSKSLSSWWAMVANADIWLVPLINDNPSFAVNSTATSPLSNSLGCRRILPVNHDFTFPIRPQGTRVLVMLAPNSRSAGLQGGYLGWYKTNCRMQSG